MSNEPSEQSSFWQRMGRASVRSLRIILILAVIAGFIAAHILRHALYIQQSHCAH